ncbi:MAG: hypothetical protein S4CHLAM102_01030 [Chlamydiia bacterium]|nr:hypothetical protein [Chlamydiia bacterium]
MDNDTPPPRRRGARWIGWIIFIILIAIALFIVFIPQILSSPAGNRWILNRYGKKLDGKLTAQKLTFSWAARQTGTAIAFVPNNKFYEARVGSLAVQDGLFSLVFGTSEPIKMKLDNPSLHIYQVGQQQRNSPQNAFALIMMTNLEVKNGKIIMFKGKEPLYSITQINGNFRPSDNYNQLITQLTAKIQNDGNTGGIKINGKIAGKQGKSLISKSALDLAKKGEYFELLNGTHTQFQCFIDQFPTQLLDFFVLTPVKPSSILGPKLYLNTTFNNHNEVNTLDLRLNSQYLKVGLQGQCNSEFIFTPIEPINVSFMISDELSTYLMSQTNLQIASPPSNAITLQVNPANTRIDLNRPLQQSSIPAMDLALGTLLINNAGQITGLIDILSLSIPRDRALPLTFQKSRLSLHGGVLNIPQTSVLLDQRYPLLTYGNVNFNNDELKLKVIITAQALERAFKIANLSTNTNIELKLDGPINDPELHTSKAKRQIMQILLEHGLLKDKNPKSLPFFN